MAKTTKSDKEKKGRTGSTESTSRKSSTKSEPVKKKGSSVKGAAPRKKASEKKSSESREIVKKTPNIYTLLTGEDDAAESKDPKAPVAKISDTDDDMIDPVSLSRGDVPMSVIDHLDEFRSRILVMVTTILLFTIVGFFFSDYLLKVLTRPFAITGQKLNIFTLTGGFMIRMKASFVMGIILGLPVLIFQVWRFVAPAITRESRGFSRNMILFAPILFYAGIAFVFFGILPLAIEVLLSFVGTDMLSTIGADDYLSFVMVMGLAMGALFELPIVAIILTRMGIISPEFLVEKRKIAIVIIWVIAAVITPSPDILSQAVVALPLMFLYEVSIFISKIVIKSKIRREIAQRQEEEY